MSGQVSRGSAGEYQADERACVVAQLASIRLMSRQVSRGSAGEYQPQSINYLFVCRVSVQKSICLRLSVMGLPGGSVLKNLPAMQETWV